LVPPVLPGWLGFMTGPLFRLKLTPAFPVLSLLSRSGLEALARALGRGSPATTPTVTHPPKTKKH
jgi:hypothetical protein